MVLNKLYVCLLVILMIFISGCSSVPKEDPKKVVKDFHDNIKKGDYEGAYNLLAESTKKKINMEAFILFHDLSSEICEFQNYTIENIDSKNLDLQRKKYVQYYVSLNRRTYRDNMEQTDTYKVLVVNENGIWKLTMEDTNINKKIADVYSQIGWMYHYGDGGKEKDLIKSAQYFRKAINAESNYGEAYYGLGRNYALQDRYDEAIEQLKIFLTKTRFRYTDISIDYQLQYQSDAYNLLGICYFYNGDREKAKDAYQKAIEIEPANEYARKNLSDLLRG